ncbi:NADPH-dependent ferric-chelate reductase [Micromonospora sp. MW-13]|uniref:siderophore-interacting protein n=1 Tax=unclassified Micromonospora TaxID=2617518 RepID=UPI000E43F584|nr:MULTISPECIES: siderophore-interacting protein [unclassified Micromonospora]MCX4471686.1 siderophore-interacting protein [Micromonospora sp. NBC_01655]RGC66784.1 NADPH-dependent ferric-chelate reductase [Micromonospora sp. MW-13]
MTVDRHDPATRVAAHHRAGSGTARIGYPIGVRSIRVVARQQLTPRILRLTLAGPALAGFHTYQADDHVKIVFPDPDGTRRDPVPNGQGMLDWPRPLPTTRKYTVRRYDAAGHELDLDFVLHDGGVASTWATSAAVGDEVTIAGPPGAKAFPHHYDHYVFAVDSTALPAVGRWLDHSPADVSAHVVVEVDDAAERGYPLASRDGVTVTWLVRESTGSTLAEEVRSLRLPAGRAFLFAAGEATDIRPLRAWSRDGLDSLITGYWKRGIAGLED